MRLISGTQRSGGSGALERRVRARVDGDGMRIAPITDVIAYPLHRRTLSVWQRYGRAGGIVLGGFLWFVGALFLLSVVRQRSVAAVVIGIAAVGLGIVAVFAGRALGTFRASAGMVALQPDRLEIADEQVFPQPILLLRHEILAICSPGMVDDQPQMRVHIQATHDVMQIGPERPNVEVWLTHPMHRPGARPGRHRPIAVLQMTTPGAAAMIQWFREGLTELAPPRWYEGQVTDLL